MLTDVRLFYYPDQTFRTDVLQMINPAATIVFDLFLIGAAAAVIGSMVKEYLDSRTLRVGRGRPWEGTGVETHPRAVRAPRQRIGAVRAPRRRAVPRPATGLPPAAITRSRAKPRDMAQVI